MLDITQKACKEARHDVQVAEMLHQVTLFHKIVEVARQVDHFCLVVVGILIVRRVLDAVDERDEVLIGYRELLK